MSYTFRVVIEDDEFEDGRKAYTAHCPALPGCHTWGYTYEHALEMIQEAVGVYVESMLEDGRPIPSDDAARARAALTVSV